MRGPGTSIVLTAILAIAVNDATDFLPVLVKNAWIAWSVVGVVVLLQLVASARSKLPLLEPEHPRSMQPPDLGLPLRDRRSQLARLNWMVRRPGRRYAVICGPIGIGKSALAAELVACVRARGGTAWWIRWSDRETVAAQLKETLGLTISDLGVAFQHLAGHSRWLLVIDNVDDPQHFSPPREPGGGLLLITSRSTDRDTWGQSAKVFELDQLSTGDSAAVLLDVAEKVGVAAGDRPQARALAARLGGSPLLLGLAALTLTQPTARRRTFDAYREALSYGPGQGSRETWELFLDQLDETYSLARPLLRVLTLSADGPLPRDLITPELVDGEATHGTMVDTIAALHGYRLIDLTEDAIPCVTLQPLVRELSSLLTADEAGIQSRQDALDRILLADAGRTADRGPAGWDRARLLAPHLAPVLLRLTHHPERLLAALDTLNRVADALHDAGDAVGEGRLLSSIVEAMSTIHGPDHVDTLDRRNDLGCALYATGEYGSAVVQFERAVSGYQRIREPDHVDTLGCRNNLAVAVHATGLHERSVPMIEHTVADFVRVSGVNDPDTLACRANFAEVLLDAHELDRAVEMLSLNLDGWMRTFGPEHPRTLRSRDKLATVLAAQGALDQAVALHEQTLAVRARVLGSDRRDTVHTQRRITALRAAMEREGRNRRWFQPNHQPRR